jgi:hypothetical protein
MTNWQKSTKREAPKTKAELREMLSDAVRNTQQSPAPAPKPQTKAKNSSA